MSEQQNYRLGLDIGVASVGAALLGDNQIIKLFVRTFDKAETAKEGESLNKIRRESRLTRRRNHRKVFRLSRLRRALHQLGLIETPDIKSLVIQNVSPWDLRAKALTQKLQPKELAFVLYHLLKHRGFQSNRKSEIQEDEKAGQMLSGVAQNKALLEAKNYATIGEMVAKDESFHLAKRNKGGDYSHTFARADLKNEALCIFESQANLGNEFATPALQQKFMDLLMARRPTLAGEDLLKMVGFCTFEPKEYRAPKASYSAERFVWLTKLNNLRILQLGESRALSPEDRQQIIELPFTQSKLTYKQLRRQLGLDDTAKFNGLSYYSKNGKDPEEATFFEAKYFNKLKKAYKDSGLEAQWQKDCKNPQKLNQLAFAQTVFKDDFSAQDWLSSSGIEYNIIEAILSIAFSEFIRLSSKALDKILPFMEEGKRYDEAVILAGYGHHSQLNLIKKTNQIPPLDPESFTNPVVYRSINQTRKLVNAIVKEYGSPMSVHIELARDLNKSFKERKDLEREQKENQQNREQAVATFEDRFGKTPNGLDLIKERLYREQFGQCAYSQQPIDLNRLTDIGYVEVDHALPYSRSFDNSYTNKVLVLTRENRNKGNRTPFEYLNGAQNDQAWLNFEAWVRATIKNPRKSQKLLRKDFGQDQAKEFKDRNLNDTRYAGRVMKNLIETHLQLAEDSTAQRCIVVSGQLTAFLRGKWGLHKVREDGDKHHALDAAVVAACSHSMVKKLSDHARKEELAQVKRDYIDPETGEVLDIVALRQQELEFPKPWPQFRNELLARLSDNPQEHLQALQHYLQSEFEALQPLRVSRMPTRRGLGAAHQETIRSIKHLASDQQSSIKTPLSKLSLKSLEKIQGYEDPRNRRWIEALQERLAQHQDKADKAFALPIYKPSKVNGFNSNIAILPEFHGEQPAPQIKSVRLLEVQKSGLLVRNGIANNGDMLRIDIFTKGGKYFVVPLYVADAVKEALPNKAAVQGKLEVDWIEMDDTFQFLFSLYSNDWVKISYKSKAPKEGYYASFNRATTNIDLWAHDRSQKVGKEGLMQSIGIKTAQLVEKFHVDILGQLHRVESEVRQPLKPKSCPQKVVL